MTKKDYIIIAKGIGECLSSFPLTQHEIIINTNNFCKVLRGDNPKFNAAIFTSLVCDTYIKYSPYRKEEK